jgi:hypothetical protein
LEVTEVKKFHIFITIYSQVKKLVKWLFEK